MGFVVFTLEGPIAEVFATEEEAVSLACELIENGVTEGAEVLGVVLN